MKSTLNSKDYVTFARRFVKETVATMDIEELREANAKISLIINNLDDFREERMKDKMERLGITDKLDERLSTHIK